MQKLLLFQRHLLEVVVDQLERRLADQGLNLNDTNTIKVDGSSSDKSNILDTIKLDKALRLAKQKSKDDQFEEAKNIYADILQKFPKNKQALTALLTLRRPIIIWAMLCRIRVILRQL